MSRAFLLLSAVLVLSCLLSTGCTGGGTFSNIALPEQSGALLATLADPVPYSPGVDPEPEIANTANSRRPLTAAESGAEAHFAAELGDPNRIVLHPALGYISPQNVVGAGNGEAVGMWTASTFAAQGSVVNMGVQKNYTVSVGGNFFHTHQFVNNQCFEYGINYSSLAPTLFGYNWCAGGNTSQGWINDGLVGDPGGALNTWDSTGNGWLFAWDSVMGIYTISLEEVQRSDGWHLLGYNWSKKKYYDIMNGHGVTGTKSACCGWDVFEVHVTPGASCSFDPSFPIGQHLLYDIKKQVLINGTWKTLDKVPSGGFASSTMIDCADISGNIDPGYASPYFSGEYYSTASSPHYYGDWWLTAR